MKFSNNWNKCLRRLDRFVSRFIGTLRLEVVEDTLMETTEPTLPLNCPQSSSLLSSTRSLPFSLSGGQELVPWELNTALRASVPLAIEASLFLPKQSSSLGVLSATSSGDRLSPEYFRSELCSAALADAAFISTKPVKAKIVKSTERIFIQHGHTERMNKWMCPVISNSKVMF